jgi:hypothetical protein
VVVLASGIAVFAALLATQGGTEFEAGARVETRAGQAPTGLRVSDTGLTVLAEQDQLLLAVSPTVGLRWTSPKSEARAISDTRVLWRPEPYWGQRPLVLESVDLSHLTRPDERSRLRLGLRASYGEEDYISLLQQFTNQPTLPPPHTMFTLNASGDASWKSSRRTSALLQLAATHRRALDKQDTGDTVTGLPNLPTQSTLVVTPGLRHTLDRRSSLEFLLAVTDNDIQDLPINAGANARVNILSFQPELGLVRELNRRHQLRASVGMTYAVVLANPQPTRNWHPVAPLGRVELGSWLWRARTSNLRSILAASTAWYADPVLGVTVQRAASEVRLEAQLGLRWNVGLRLGFATDLNPPLANFAANLPPPDETMVQVDLPCRYRWSSQLAIDFGARYAERAPNLWASDFTWHYREVWLFAIFTATTHRVALRPS